MGKSAKKVTVGYKYYLGVQLIVCQGPVDEVSEIVIGERSAWSGTVTSNSTININKPDLFGGDKREGGVVGDVDIEFGDETQGRNTYLTSKQDANCPSYRGLLSIIFKSFLWSSGNPYFKAPWVKIGRFTAGWNTPVWNAGNAKIYDSDTTTYDMNPAHIIYQCLTDPEWGMGYSVSDIGSSFSGVASTLYNEGFGLSLKWTTQMPIEDFVRSILDHINGILRLDVNTDKFELKLIRDDYIVANLTNINPDNILEIKSFERATYGDFANEIVVTYTDRSQNEKSIAVQDLASIHSQGSVVSVTKSYPAIRSEKLAARVALRDLTTSCSPLAKLECTTNRVMWDKEIGDVVTLTLPDEGIVNMTFRIISISKGTLTDSAIDVQMVEDVFGLPSTTYVGKTSNGWVDPLSLPTAVAASFAVEAPYWQVITNLTRADQAQLEPYYGFGELFVAKQPSQSPFYFSLQASPDNGTYSEVSQGHFCPTGQLSDAITRTQTTFTLTNFYDLSEAPLDGSDNGYAYIDNECVAVVSVNASNGTVVVRRGVLDTVVSPHSAGARMYFVADSDGLDPTERVIGETVYYKPLPTTGLGSLPIGSASAVSLVLNNRASRPYPPGQFKVNGVYWPLNITDSVNLTWAHRDRLSQTVTLVDYTQPSIGPEVGATYKIRIYNNTTLIRTYSGVSGTAWTYPLADEKTDNYIQTLRVKITTEVAGMESLYPQDHTFERYGLGFHLGESLGGLPPP